MSDSVREVATHAELLDALGPVAVGGRGRAVAGEARAAAGVARAVALVGGKARAAAGGPRAVALVGGADFTEPDRLSELRAFFATLAGYLERSGMALVDGGTDSGVMRLIAEARTLSGATFPLVGVAPRGAFDRTTRTGAPIARARGHSIVLLVPGSRFGDESEWLFLAADHLAGGSAPTIVVNGGKLTLDEAHLRLGQGHRVVAVAGTGRAADELAADEGLRGSGRLRVIPVTVDEAGLAAAIEPAIAAAIEPVIAAEIDPAIAAEIDPAEAAGIDPAGAAGIDPAEAGRPPWADPIERGTNE